MHARYTRDPSIGILCVIITSSIKDIFIRENDTFREDIEDNIKKKLGREPVMLIDPFRGFCLSHEKCFLPLPDVRKSFGFIHIPKEILNKYSGRHIKVISSGRKGYAIIL